MKIGLFADAQSIHIRQLVAGLVELAHDVTVITHKAAEIPGAAVERFHVPSPTWNHPRRWASRRMHYLRSFLHRFDVINIHFLQDWGFPVDWIEQGCFVVTAWGSDIVDPPGETPADHQLKSTRVTLLQHAAAITTCGPTFASTVAEYGGIDVHRIDVVPFGVNRKRFQPDHHALNTAKDFPRIGFYKGFREVYGPMDLIRAIPLVLQRYPRVRFEFIGDGPQLIPCQTLAKELSIEDSVDWISRQAHEQIPRWLKRWMMTVIPSVHEAFGVAALETSAMGLPVVASDVCGLRDTVLHEKTGLLTPPYDSPSLAQCMNALLDNPERCRRMGTAGRSMVQQHYDWQRIYNRWVSLYEKALDRTAVMI